MKISILALALALVASHASAQDEGDVGPSTCFQENTKFRGGRTFKKIRSVVSVEDCQSLCAGNEYCSYFSYTTKDFEVREDNRHVCYMNWGNANLESRTVTGVVSGPAYCEELLHPEKSCFKQGYAYVKNFVERKIAKGNIWSVAACQDRCNRDEECEFFTYYTREAKRKAKRRLCFMHRGAAASVPMKMIHGAVAGPKTCTVLPSETTSDNVNKLSIQTNRACSFRSSVSLRYLREVDFAQCLAACNADLTCSAFTLAEETGRCTMYSACRATDELGTKLYRRVE